MDAHTLRLLERLITLAKGMLTACGDWLRDKQQQRATGGEPPAQE